ncbi:MAG: hypothetical protein D6721_00155 [Gammaproteobacteria bacterium]|nr:MAG: hypothetical protein D6721_00155 [Gammaproteobacteria bacterium]
MKDRTLAALVSFAAGAMSLAAEVVWLRWIAFVELNTPQTLGLVLGVFLFGIVSGALLGRDLCARLPDPDELKQRMGLLLLASGLLDGLAPAALTWMGDPNLLPLAMYCFTYLTATVKATLFPIVHHLGSQGAGQATGRSVARVYFMNILGATASPLLVSFWLLDHLGSDRVLQGVGLLALALATLVLARTRTSGWHRAGTLLAAPAALGLVLVSPGDRVLRHLAFGADFTRLPLFIENRQGIVHTTHNPTLGDGVFGGNVYDGRINLDPYRDSNGITRAYLLTVLHPHPRRALEIGLGSGSWARVLAAIPSLERLDIVEINPAYLEVLRHYPAVRPLLADPRVHIHIDDGRRWLRRYRGAPYDLILSNTTHHWRAYATNLLSVQFLEIVQAHLAPDGIFAYNSTGSPDVLYTASRRFPFAFEWSPGYFVYAGRRDFRHPEPRAARRRLQATLARLGLPARGPAFERLAERLTHPRWIDAATLEEAVGRPLERVTDRNLLTEYRRSGRPAAFP